MSQPWSVSIERSGPSTARVVFCPAGVSVGPTFAVREPQFEPVPIPGTGAVTVCEGRVSVSVQPDGRFPHADNLRIEWTSRGRRRTWRPGDLDHENLGAAFFALDNLWRDYVPAGVRPADPMAGYDDHIWNTATLTAAIEKAYKSVRGKYPETEERNTDVRRLVSGKPPLLFPDWPADVHKAYDIVRHSPPGLLTRSGLSLFRDGTPPWDAQSEWIGAIPGPQPFVLYLVYHDCDWRLAVRELTRLLGPIPRIPSSLLGVWYSNYAPFGAADLQKIVAGFAEYNLPLDTISVDMDWHDGGWYGYGWNQELFPDPDAFAAWLRQERLKATFNVHPLYVPATEARLEEFKQAAGHSGEVFGEAGDWHPFQANTLKVDIEDPRHVQAYLELHRRAEDAGCDFWWIDGSVLRPDGRDDSSWLNHVYRAHLAKRPGHTPIVLARAGGLGGHRDVILFTGDACSQWEILAFEVEASIRAVGGLIAYVSHDIGGFWHDAKDRPTNQPPDHLYVRWLQFGCLSPIMRLHSFNGVREPWRFAPDTLRIARRFMQLRMRLMLYLDRLVDVAHETGLPLLRPMWFEFDSDEAYECTGQYMLGERLLVAPVTREDAKVRYWLPPGAWHDAFANRTLTGPKWVEETVAMYGMPLWLKEGTSLDLAKPTRKVRGALVGFRETVRGPGWAVRSIF